MPVWRAGACSHDGLLPDFVALQLGLPQHPVLAACKAQLIRALWQRLVWHLLCARSAAHPLTASPSTMSVGRRQEGEGGRGQLFARASLPHRKKQWVAWEKISIITKPGLASPRVFE